MTGDNAMDHGEPHPRAFSGRLGREEGIENLPRHFRGHAAPRIPHG
jgi:hypothetical protein